jgi:hypothetical protein
MTNIGNWPESPSQFGHNRSPDLPRESSICFWAVHVVQTEHLGLYDTTNVPRNAETTNIPPASFPDVLSQNFQRNTFSDTSESSLPLSVPMLHAAATTSKSPLLTASVAFAIMSRNTLLLSNLLAKMKEENLTEEIYKTHPLHLAATYLDGAKSCCSVLE